MYIKLILLFPIILTLIWSCIILKILFKKQFYHLNFRCIICCILIHGILHYTVEIIGDITFLILKKNIIIITQNELRQFFITVGYFYFQIFIIVERLIAIILIKKYENISTNKPYLGLIFIIISYSFYFCQKYIFYTNIIIQDYILIGTEILSTILSFIYFFIMRIKHKKEKRFSLKFIEKNLSTKYQTFENEKSFGLSIGIIIIFLLFNFFNNLLNLSILQKYLIENILIYKDILIIIISIVRNWCILILLIRRERRIKNNLMKMFSLKSSKIYEISLLNDNGNKTVDIHIIPQSEQQCIYFNSYQKQWYF
uniref:7TM GPCR serpentine receptor class x (Srx) domain-containing protein n=1 Tax=Strongyloides stercoralis TaxID=6248 RepID=A0A0K0E439_STRER